jgi:hypothetical protein
MYSLSALPACPLHNKRSPILRPRSVLSSCHAYLHIALSVLLYPPRSRKEYASQSWNLFCCLSYSIQIVLCNPTPRNFKQRRFYAFLLRSSVWFATSFPIPSVFFLVCVSCMLAIRRLPILSPRSKSRSIRPACAWLRRATAAHAEERLVRTAESLLIQFVRRREPNIVRAFPSPACGSPIQRRVVVDLADLSLCQDCQDSQDRHMSQTYIPSTHGRHLVKHVVHEPVTVAKDITKDKRHPHQPHLVEVGLPELRELIKQPILRLGSSSKSSGTLGTRSVMTRGNCLHH